MLVSHFHLVLFFFHCFVRTFVTKFSVHFFVIFVSKLSSISAVFGTVGTVGIADLSHTSWQQDPQTGTKQRVVNFTMPLNQSLGPKSSQVTETQVSSTWHSDIYGGEMIYHAWDISTS
jgi:hypothetical protein